MPPTDEHTRISIHDPQIVQALDDLIRQVGGDPEELGGEFVREMLQGGLQLVSDGADTGELKLASRSLRELRYALKVFRPYRDQPKVTIFGSARTPLSHPHYEAALRFSTAIRRAGWMVITGAGDGVMRAGNEGAGRESSFGASIRLPFETNANDIIVGDEKLVTFRYFFTRKLIFVSQADALALFPGGFGTLDEAFEVLMLVQTGKSGMIPIVMIDAPGGTYWSGWDRMIRDNLLRDGMISPEDVRLYHVTEDPDAAVAHIRQFYRNYHSQRFVGERMVLRIRRPLAEKELDALNSEFADLIEEGRIELSGPLEEEQEYPDLPRLSFVFTRRDYGRLRMMIDRINEMGEG